jgi:hypothetical protein
VNVFTDRLYTRLETTSNYSATANIHKLPQHPLSLFQPAVSSPAVPWQRLLTVEILQLRALRSSLHNLPCRTPLNYQLTLPFVYILTWTTQKTQFCFCCVRVSCPWNVFTEPFPRNGSGAEHRKHCSSVVACMLRALPSNGRFLQSHRLAKDLYATIRQSSYHSALYSLATDVIN